MCTIYKFDNVFSARDELWVNVRYMLRYILQYPDQRAVALG